MKRTIVIGDLHGCYNEAVQLMDTCKVTVQDRVIFAGDLVDRGPDSAKCVELAMKHECVLGNHEEKHLIYRVVDVAGKTPNVTSPAHVETRRQLTDVHYAYMQQLPLVIKLPEHNAIVVHAGAFPGVPIDFQSHYHLLHIQMIDPKTSTNTKWPSKAQSDWKFWTHYWNGPERVIFGHTVIDTPLVLPNAVGIDGGCVFGHELWGLILPDWEIVRVKGSTDYGKGSRGNSNERIKKFEIAPGVFSYS